MRTFIRTISLALVGLTVASCHSTTSDTSTSAVAKYPPIVRLQNRSYAIQISAGPRSPLYSITNSAGRLLCDNITLTDLQSQHRDLFNLLAPALAPNATATIADSPIIFADDR